MTTSSPNKSRPLANFHSTVWGYHFLSYTPEISIQEKVEIDELEEIFRKMLVETCDNSTQKLVLIDTIQQLGVAYHFHNEIKTSIQNIFDTTISQLHSENIDGNLYVVSLRFRLLRQQGHHISSADVFKQFMDQDGKFKETLTNDVQGLLSLYEASHLRMRDEEILEEALTFATNHLESIVSNLSNNSLKVEVTEALKQPIRKTLPRVGARKYISTYEHNDAHNHLLLKFAKLDFNALQKLHQSELSELTRY
uniref:Sesquiterpene synthase 2 n=2 Tax=Solanum tuberosum TaxID=4113 RepID=M1BR25_SOLTU